MVSEDDLEKKTPAEKREDLAKGESEAEVYDEQGREQLVEDDEMSPTEEGFMEGAEGKGELGNCAQCGKPLVEEKEDLIETKEGSEILHFCCEECLEKHKEEN